VAASEVPAGGDVVMIDSGVQTKEPLNFATGLLSDDPQTIVEYLKRAHELPDLAGKQVYFFGLGWTASPQPSLGISYRSKVVQIWQAIAHAAGAKCVGVDQNANTKAAVPNLPAVSLVHPPKPLAPPVACSTTDLNDANHVGFVFDSTTFRDPAGARVTLRKLANVILNNDDSIKLTGSTSSEGSDAYNQVLSLHRAQAVRAELEQFGVPGSRITAFGDGSHLPGRVNDRGPNGQLLIGPAIQNRKVVAKLTGPKCHSK
jgi:outer membrane protein OmpA-like peptidoglycan-associated protein